ncbi:MAG: hypothetical protein ACUVUU_01305 [bacterium]
MRKTLTTIAFVVLTMIIVFTVLARTVNAQAFHDGNAERTYSFLSKSDLWAEFRQNYGSLAPQYVRFGNLRTGAIEFPQGFEVAWQKTLSRSRFERTEKSLPNFSNIDIPVKFPETVGRVIGQGANLRVSGSEEIKFGGQTRYRVNERLTEYGRRSRFPTLDMKQHLKINLEGTVGEKIHVLVQHDSDIDTPLENRIKLRYEGYDDEIIQKIEMGNTSLTIPGSQFVSYSGQQQGLFGAKMLAKLGSLDITAVASKQEGRTASASFRPNVRDSVVLSDIDFIRSKYFFLMDPYKISPDGEFKDVEVYVDDGIGTNNDRAVTAYAFLDADRSKYPDPSKWDSITGVYFGQFDVLEPNKDYAVDLRTGDISLLRSLPPSHALAVRYVYQHGDQADTVGGWVEGALMLKIIRPTDEILTNRWDIWGETLKYERKNVYSIGATYIVEDKVEVVIYRRTSPVDKEIQRYHPYTKILGIDLFDENGIRAGPQNSWRTDGYVDGGWINGEAGLLTFPDLRPFDPDVKFVGARPETLLAEDRNPDIYDRNPIELRRKSDFSKFYMVIRFTTPHATFKMGQTNILENSEVVILNGRRLTRNVDYEIYYETGQIKFLTEEALDPNAVITVDYEYVPFLSLAQQSLLGLGGVYKLSPTTNLTGIWLYQSKKSPEERPRLGQEPAQIMVGDLNLKTSAKPDLMTAIADAISFTDVSQPSKVDVEAEIAMSFPNPNTKGSVYIDDMEGVRDMYSFSIYRDSWVPSSPPHGYRWENTQRIYWYVRENEVQERDIFPNAEPRPGATTLPVMEVDFRGKRYYWMNDVIYDESSRWAGLMRLVSRSGADFSELEFFEVWLKPKVGNLGKIHIDFGAISEDYYRPWLYSLDTEDRDNNGVLSADENTGLDGVFTGQPGDDPDDDYEYKGDNDFSKINGTEGDPRISPDTEDLDGDGILDLAEVHFRISFDLNDPKYIVTRTAKGWALYRIPLKDAVALNGSPSWKAIKYMRFFFTDVDSGSVYQIAYMQVTGASWLHEGIRVKDTMEKGYVGPNEGVEISAKNTKDDPDYDPPYDPGRDPQGYRRHEQSLVLTVKNLSPGNCGSIYKPTSAQPQDYTLYRKLSFYLHSTPEVESESLYFFVRVGKDSVNFYEFGTKIRSGWREVEVPIADLTNLKTMQADTVSLYGVHGVLFRKRLLEDGWMAVYGSPSITAISRIGAGIVNLGGIPTASDAIEIWFDDLRLTDVMRNSGLARRFSVRSSFSDVMSIDFDYRATDTEFQTLSVKRRASDDRDYVISFATSLEKLAPLGGFSMPFSARYRRSSSLPTLASRSDVVLRRDQRKMEQRSLMDQSFRLGFSKSRKSQNFLGRLTLDCISTNVAYSAAKGYSPELADTSFGYTGSFSYRLSPWWKTAYRVYRGYTIGYFPDQIGFDVTGQTRNLKKVNLRQGVVTDDRYTREITGTFNLSMKLLQGPAFTSNYMIRIQRDMDTNKNVPIISSIGLGTELNRNQTITAKLTPKISSWLSPAVSYDVNYDENADPKLKAQTDPRGARRVNLSSGTTLSVRLSPGASAERKMVSDTTRVSFLRAIFSRIPDMDFDYKLDRRVRSNRVLGRPGLKFQLGIDLSDFNQVPTSGTSGVAQTTDEQTTNEGLTVSTEFRPFALITVKAALRTNKSERTYAGSRTFSNSTIWPDITGSTSSITSLASLSRIWKSSTLSVGYKSTKTQDGRGDGTKSAQTQKVEWSPLLGWDATWQNNLRTTLNIRRAETDVENFSGTASLNRTVNNSISFQLRHSLSAPEGMYIPLAGRTIKFRSNLTLSLDISYESTVSRTPTSSNRTDRDTRRFSIIPKASYTFSKNVTGSADARFIQETDNLRKDKYRSIGLGVSVLVRF